MKERPEKSINDLSGVSVTLGWESLFDGQSMDQWRRYKADDVEGWEVKDDMMTALGTGMSADIITKETYTNFSLSLEWKTSQKGNSGIFFNVVEADHLNHVYESGPEYQILDDASFIDQIEPWQLTGANYAMHGPKYNKVMPVGEWNTSRLIVDNGKVQHWLNDRLVVSYTIWTDEWNALKNEGKWKDYPDYGKHHTGHIALQDHGGQVSYRKLKIRRLK